MCPNYRRVSPRHPQLSIHLEASTTFNLPEVVLHPEDISNSEPYSAIPRPLPLRGLSRSEVLTSLGSPPLQDPPRSEDFNSEPESSYNRLSLITVESCATSFSSTFITCNASINMGSYGQWRVSRNAIPTNQHP